MDKKAEMVFLRRMVRSATCVIAVSAVAARASRTVKLEDRFSRWWELLNRPIRPTDDGDASGTLRFAGVPRYDGRKREISVPDLDYGLETDSRLVNAYVWLRSDELWDVFRSRAQLSVDPALERGRMGNAAVAVSQE